MKKIFYIMSLVILVACADKYEDTHKFSSLYKYQVIKLDASKVLVDIQVKSAINPEAAFKIVSNDQYIFVGEMMKGIHVYEKTDSRHAKPLCFIECKYLKAFEVKNNLLYCNNFVDLLFVDVENPAQARVLYRRIGHFNYSYYSNYYGYSNQLIPNDGYTFELGTVTIQLPKAEIFYNDDELYESIVVDEIPATLNYDKPYVGFARVDDLIYTYSYMYSNGSLVICDYTHAYSTSQSLIGNSNYYYPIIDMRYEGKILYMFGNGSINYFDSDHILTQTNNYLWISNIKNVSYMESQSVFWILSNSNTISGGISLDGQNYPKSTNAPDVSGMLCIGNNLITLGKSLVVYNTYPLPEPFTVVKQYPDIQGLCMAKDGAALMVANKQGLAFYDISDLENIKLIP